MITRLFSPDDLQACTALFIEVFNQEPWNDRWTPEAAEQYVSDYINTPGFRGIVAEEGQEIKGFILGVRKRWWDGDEL
ncbi:MULTISPECIES: GNAT family N-acetyltransferase [Paenibacillus]|uniref:hypothetical protein n=1 Tax=Paenibacillus TaxID=44249 RepID=UPI0022B8DCA5|nr:hypothetical protein [Paenibacillus caseinilyticus]MCZ8517926.1 hypothetical protein [Paenibacillus caseinilyticus]